MTLDEFNAVYDEDTVQLASYKTNDGYTLKGKIVLGVSISTKQTAFICVDNFFNRVLLENVYEVINTKEKW